MSLAEAKSPDGAAEPENGTRRCVDGKESIYYDGYWIRYYCPPPNTLAAKKRLIDSLTRRLFHHTEVGINTPGERLETARVAFENEQDPKRRRVCGAMLAGALFNRATDIFTSIVDLAEKGVETSEDNELMKLCADYFMEALELGKTVKHYSGHEGIDELWGEPLKAFALPIADFYDSRYVKIAQTMRDIDRVADALVGLLEGDEAFTGMPALIRAFAEAAKHETETMRSDTEIFDVWPEFVACGERLVEFEPAVPPSADDATRDRVAHGKRIILDGKLLLTYLAGARVPMPKSTRAFLDHCQLFRSRRRARAAAVR